MLKGIRPRDDLEQHILPSSVCSRYFNIYDPADPIVSLNLSSLLFCNSYILILPSSVCSRYFNIYDPADPIVSLNLSSLLFCNSYILILPSSVCSRYFNIYDPADPIVSLNLSSLLFFNCYILPETRLRCRYQGRSYIHLAKSQLANQVKYHMKR